MLSKNYKHWISWDDPKRCLPCEKMHGKIYKLTETPIPKPPLHPFCRCVIKIMEALKAGTATDNKLDGADLNYKFGFRNLQRVLWSNDGLIFVSYDHYKTFYEIT